MVAAYPYIWPIVGGGRTLAKMPENRGQAGSLAARLTPVFRKHLTDILARPGSPRARTQLVYALRYFE